MVIIIWMLVWQMATALQGSLVRNILKSQLKAFKLEICYQLRSSPHPPGNQFWKCLISTFFISPPSEVPREAWLDHLSWIRRLLQSVTENEDAGEDVRWDELQDALHFIALLSSTGLLLEISHTVILYVSSSLRLDTGGYLDTDDLIFSDRFSPEVLSCFSQMLVQEKCVCPHQVIVTVLNDKIE